MNTKQYANLPLCVDPSGHNFKASGSEPSYPSVCTRCGLVMFSESIKPEGVGGYQPHRVSAHSVAKLVSVWTDKGVEPKYHDQMLKMLAHSWPVLYDAINQIVREHGTSQPLPPSADVQIGLLGRLFKGL